MNKLLNRTYLQVPFIEKDRVKHLGARFDFQRKQWYIEDHLDRELFNQWLTNEKNSSINTFPNQQVSANTQSVESTEKEEFSLISLLSIVQQSIKQKFNSTLWLKSEVVLVKKSNSNYYLELIQRDRKTNQEIAKAKAIIWSKNSYKVKKFEAITNKRIEANMMILMQVVCQFHVRFGFSIEIVDVDANYTLGDTQRKLLLLKKTLISQGLFNKNKGVSLSKYLTDVIVISPENAAGLADFKHFVQPLVGEGIIKCNYFTALFQGDKAASNIISILKKVELQKKKTQLVIIIRGGGATTDLQYLEDEGLITFVCKYSIPVWIGIGHQVDHLILNEVSHQSFSTPTALAKELVLKLIEPLQRAISDWNEIKLQSSAIIYKRQLLLKNNKQAVEKYATKVIRGKERKLIELQLKLRDLATQSLIKQKYRTKAMKNKVLDLSFRKLEQQKLLINNLNSRMSQSSQLLVKNTQSTLFWYGKIIEQNHPTKILKRGYAIIRTKDKKAISNINSLFPNNELIIEMKDGTKHAILK